MRSSGSPSELERALGEYAQAAAHLLHADIVAGAEVELELGSQRGRARTPFYSCRPLTGRFIAEREAQLQGLPEHGAAVSALAEFDGLDRYLASRGGETRAARGNDLAKGHDRADRSGAHSPDGWVGQHARARQALKMLLDDVFAEQTEFELVPSAWLRRWPGWSAPSARARPTRSRSWRRCTG